MENTHKTKFLVFSRTKLKNKKTYNVEIKNKYDELIGEIYWRTGWRTYVVNIAPDIDLDTKCLDDISGYIKLLLEERLKDLNKEEFPND